MFLMFSQNLLLLKFLLFYLKITKYKVNINKNGHTLTGVDELLVQKSELQKYIIKCKMLVHTIRILKDNNVLKDMII